MSNTATRPTAKQLRYLRALAQKTGTTFAPPRDRREASREISRMRHLPAALVERRDEDGEPIDDTDDAGGQGTYANGGGREETRRGVAPRLQQVLVATHSRDGSDREVITMSVGEERLVVDRAAQGGDERLLARLAVDEPASNADLVARMFIADPGGPRCRRLTRGDLQPQRSGGPAPVAAGAGWRAPLVAGVGAVFRLGIVSDRGRQALRWAEHREEARPVEAISLRDVVGRLEAYQPAIAMTRAALAAQRAEAGVSTVTLATELARLVDSPLVLNHLLRHRVQRAVESEGVSMSEIASRCGRVKRDGRGSKTGETSWLARRIGVMPEGGGTHPTPWVHTDVLALIARDGLGIDPREVEMC